jgi:glycosyltransferase involved in cell wall biosynthesis
MNFFTLAELLLATAAIVLLGLAFVFASQCLLGSLRWRQRQPPQPSSRPRLAVLIPAHNESAGIAGTIHNLLPQLTTGDRLVVIADNCTDDTAQAARQAASEATATAEVLILERHDPEHRGKGYALAFGRAALTAEPPEVVVFVDADCRVTSGTVADLAAWAHETGRPIQADYLLSTPNQGKRRLKPT